MLSKEIRGPQGLNTKRALYYKIDINKLEKGVIKDPPNEIMVQVRNLIDRIDTIRANSVSDKEFEQTWGESLDRKVKKSMDKWDELLAQAKKAIEVSNQ